MKIQEKAKTQSEAFLIKNGIPVNKALPFIEAPEELAPQPADAVARRSLVLGYIIGIGFGQPGSRLKAELEKWDLYQYVSNSEKALLTSNNIKEQEKINATWQTECVQSLAWGLGLADLDHFRRCDDNLGPKFPIMQDPTIFIQRAALRSFDEIYFESDLLYRLHWASRNARLHGNQTNLTEGLIRERRKAVDWMIGVAEDWDEIPSDT